MEKNSIGRAPTMFTCVQQLFWLGVVAAPAILGLPGWWPSQNVARSDVSTLKTKTRNSYVFNMIQLNKVRPSLSEPQDHNQAVKLAARPPCLDKPRLCHATLALYLTISHNIHTVYSPIAIENGSLIDALPIKICDYHGEPSGYQSHSIPLCLNIPFNPISKK